MATRIAELSPQRRARVAGLLYLSLGLFAPFSLLYVPARLIVTGDAAATANNIMASQSLFRLGIVSALVTQIVNVLVVLALYQILKPASRNMAVLMVIFLLLGVPIAMLNELNNVAVLFLLSGADSLKVLTPDQGHALLSVFLNLHANGLTIAGLFWGLWLLPMGYLVFTSGFLPRMLGALLIIGGVGYLVQSFATLLIPNFNVNIVLYTDWGELLFPLWLVIRGVNVERWKKRALAAA
jgi:hypothetical protein